MLITVAGCSASFGEKYTYKQLEIYYTPPAVNERYVESLAQYFDQNNLLLEKKHSIQLTSDQESYVLKMVLNNQFNKFPEEKLDQINGLEQDIKEKVFNGLNFKIIICNENFIPLEKQ